jgi:hypothetical protein
LTITIKYLNQNNRYFLLKMITNNRDYIEVAERLLAHARVTYDKHYVQPEELCALIGAGARVNILNQEQFGGGYIHEVVYEEQVFVNATLKPITLQISGANKRMDSEIKRLERIASEKS